MVKKKAIENEHKELQELCGLVSNCKQERVCPEEIVRAIIKRYGFYLNMLTYDEYVAWLRSDRKFAQIYFQEVAKIGCEELINSGGICLL